MEALVLTQKNHDVSKQCTLLFSHSMDVTDHLEEIMCSTMYELIVPK